MSVEALTAYPIRQTPGLEKPIGRWSFSLDGEYVPGVTTVTGVLDKPNLRKYYADEAAKVARDTLAKIAAEKRIPLPAEAALLGRACEGAAKAANELAKQRGGGAHEWIHAHALGQDPPKPTDPQQLRAIEAHLAWERQRGVRYLVSELPLASRLYGFMGILDRIVLLDGGVIALVDNKTGRGGAVWPEQRYQLAALMGLLEENLAPEHQHLMPSTRIVLYTPRIGRDDDGEGGPVPIPGDWHPDYAKFLGLLDAWRLVKDDLKWARQEADQ